MDNHYSNQQRNYQWQNVLKMVRRNRKQVFFSALGSFGYFLCLGLGLSVRRVLQEYIKIEEAPLYDDQIVDSTLGDLINLLTGIELGIVAMLVGVFIFGFFFFITGLRRQLLLNQEEIKIKRFLGSGLGQVTREFYLEYVLPLVVAGISGLFMGLVIFGFIYLVVTLKYQQNWPTPWYHPFKINAIIIIVVGGIIRGYYGKARQLIFRNENKGRTLKRD